MRAIILALLLAAPLHACLNDSRSPVDEAEFAARYTDLGAPDGGLSWRGVLLGVMSGIAVGALGLGIGFQWRERRAATAR